MNYWLRRKLKRKHFDKRCMKLRLLMDDHYEEHLLTKELKRHYIEGFNDGFRFRGIAEEKIK